MCGCVGVNTWTQVALKCLMAVLSEQQCREIKARLEVWRRSVRGVATSTVPRRASEFRLSDSYNPRQGMERGKLPASWWDERHQPPPDESCGLCGNSKFVTGPNGGVSCSACHPSAGGFGREAQAPEALGGQPPPRFPTWPQILLAMPAPRPAVGVRPLPVHRDRFPRRRTGVRCPRSAGVVPLSAAPRPPGDRPRQKTPAPIRAEVAARIGSADGLMG
jgi:hypothetical protein